MVTLDAERGWLAQLRASPSVFTIMLAGLSAFAPMSVDMYLPTWPTLLRVLATDEAGVQLSLSAFLLGMALGQLFWGAISDRFGRKAPLYAGCLLYTAASLGCLFATDITGFVILRFVQAIGASTGLILTRAMIRDRFDREDGARMLSLLMLMMGGVPLLAPSVGGVLLEAFGWRAIFVVLTGFGIVALISSVTLLEETLPPERRVSRSVREMAGGYARLLADPAFRAYLLPATCVYGGLFAYLSGTPFVYIEIYGVSPRLYGVLFGLNVAALMAGAFINSRLVRRVGIDRMMRAGLLVAGLAGAALMAAALTGAFGLAGLAVPLFVFLGSLSLVGANALAGALARFPSLAGTASALAGCLQFGFGAAAGAIVGALQDASAVPMAATIFVCTSIALLVGLWRRH